ncbi:DUF5996 family protein [Adhaeribacter radiodurans]|uniref:Ava_C0101 and related proteins n=1 Tax=Adhaeribacter radiodurans TaxID=2745197 RepID=A0A7L7L247_9BACT|nr:DUF5996 family protein [Adhaeribacter radiodurans]QMU26867.1 hypothetical protein HUW48_01935 [Adhaeribacter radiodurans]
MKSNWPELSYIHAKETYKTLLLFTQIIGKIKLTQLPWVNHAWHVTLSVTPPGLTTGLIPSEKQYFQIDFDLQNHYLIIITQSGERRQFSLKNLSVADFYQKAFSNLTELNINVRIYPVPNELEEVIPFHQDTIHATYQPEQVEHLHQVLLHAHRILTYFRAEFKGKCSPVHFFWGGFDLAVSRFSGRPAPEHPGGVPHLPDWVAQEAYSHEVSSCGFWPGNDSFPEAAFYAYIYPEPAGYDQAVVSPSAAYYHQTLREFILPYNAVQQVEEPEQAVLSFLRSTYSSAADLAGWDRAALEVSSTS